MPWTPTPKDKIFTRLKRLMESITVANGYPVTVKWVDREYALLLDPLDTSKVPRIQLRDGFEEFEERPDKWVRSTWTYLIHCSTIVLNEAGELDRGGSLLTAANQMLDAVVSAFYSDPFLFGSIADPDAEGKILVRNRIDGVTTDEGYQTPLASFVVRCVAEYDFRATFSP